MNPRRFFIGRAIGLIIVVGIFAVGYGLYYFVYPYFDEVVVQDSMPAIMTDATGYPVIDTVAHPAMGTLWVLEADAGTVLRFENFETINGPNLHVYLSKDLEGNEIIDLGPIRGTKGSINYMVPEEVDLSEYRYVLHWCVPFGVLFNYVDLQPEAVQTE